MSDFAKYALNASEYENEDPALRRVYAVGAVLEIISQKASQSGANLTNLSIEFKNLSEYADLVEAALKVK
ncbi:hypothetical protein [Pseudomonas piscis]|uniref:hypothetical protein n=1 Tax=Pseudomonas piscis TaxID=2614538 RepID=UPI0021D5D976|nr:hypothetical protein [Pseudomonas piscis]MCU7645638.1 hypothetical protein [Pseudomonas piscis]